MRCGTRTRFLASNIQPVPGTAPLIRTQHGKSAVDREIAAVGHVEVAEERAPTQRCRDGVAVRVAVRVVDAGDRNRCAPECDTGKMGRPGAGQGSFRKNSETFADASLNVGR